MNTNTLKTLDFILDEVSDQIVGFDKSRKFYQRNYFIFIIMMTFMCAITTFFIGVGEILDSKWLTITALFTSAIITVASAWDGFFRNKDMWVSKTAALRQLYALESNIRFLKVTRLDDISPRELEHLYLRFEEVIHGEEEPWARRARKSAPLNRGKLIEPTAAGADELSVLEEPEVLRGHEVDGQELGDQELDDQEVGEHQVQDHQLHGHQQHS